VRIGCQEIGLKANATQPGWRCREPVWTGRCSTLSSLPLGSRTVVTTSACVSATSRNSSTSTRLPACETHKNIENIGAPGSTRICGIRWTTTPARRSDPEIDLPQRINPDLYSNKSDQLPSRPDSPGTWNPVYLSCGHLTRP